MPKQTARAYSRHSLEALQLMGKLIQLARKERKLTAQDLAERAGISRGLPQRIENGEPTCSIGLVFETASIVGVKLFDSKNLSLPMQLERSNDKIILLPKSIRKNNSAVDDNF